MNRDMFNEKKKLSKMTGSEDEVWAEDVSFSVLERQIKENRKATEHALRPLDEKKNEKIKNEAVKEKIKSHKNAANNSKNDAKEEIEIQKDVKSGRKKFLIFLGIWSFALITIITLGLVRFYFYLQDYEKVYNESLPYHVMDDFMTVFDNDDIDSLYDSITEKPEITDFESDENAKNYILKMLEGKDISYSETAESTDKNPVYYVMADEYIVGKASMTMSDEKRAHDLPIYTIDNFEMYFEPEWSVSVQSYDKCKVYVNDVEVSEDYLEREVVPKEKHFEEFTELPKTKYYKVTNLFEQPSVKVINSFGQEITPEINNTTGIYETPFSVPKETEDEMIEFAKEAVNTYAKVVCRESADKELDSIFTKGNPIVKEIKSNSGNLKYFPNHKTKDIEDKVIEFTPFSDDAFYCEIEHTQHMLIYGVRPKDVVTDAKFYYYKEDGKWKVCAVVF